MPVLRDAHHRLAQGNAFGVGDEDIEFDREMEYLVEPREAEARRLTEVE